MDAVVHHLLLMYHIFSLLWLSTQITDSEIISTESGSEMRSSASGIMELPISHIDKVKFLKSLSWISYPLILLLTGSVTAYSLITSS